MKILMVNKFYFIKGGSERYYFELKKLLESNGHEVIPFSMQHPQNFETPYEENFIENIEFNDLNILQKIQQAPKIVSRVIYSKAVRDAVARLIDKVKPDIAHLHMIDHQLSPSLLHALHEHRIPVVQTCHQLKLVCPSYLFYIAHKNQICERCIHGDFYHAVLQRCHKKSIPASALVALESYIHRRMKIYDLIDVFHVPSRFLGGKLIEGGYPKHKIWHSFYTINMDQYPYHAGASDYFVYYGRLSEEKGLMTLLKAMKLIPEAKLYIIGAGPQRSGLESFVAESQLKNVQFLGMQKGKDLVSLVQKAKFIVNPSECYDNSPLVVYESFSMGKPAIVSTLGGMPELVDEKVNGLHFPPGDANKLAENIKTLWHDPPLCKKMSENARKKAEAEFSPEAHYEKIMNQYNRLLSRESVSEVAAHGRARKAIVTT